MGAPPYVPPTYPISTAQFWSNTYTFDPLYASDTIAISVQIAGALGVLKRGTVLFGPLQNVAITNSTIFTTVPTGASARAILAQDIDTTAGQVVGLVYVQGKFLDTAMTFSSQGAQLDCAQLWDFGVYVLTVLERSGILVPFRNLPATGGALPLTMSAKDAKQATEDEVKAIKNAMSSYQPGAAVPAVAVPPTHAEPAWAIAAFGESKPTPVDQATEKAAEQSGELQAKQEKALSELEAKQAKELSDLLQKQQQERDKLAKQTQEEVSKAQQQESHAAAPPPQHAPPPPAKNQK